LGTATAAVTKALKDINLPAGASAKIGGVSADQAAAFSSLGIALLVAILVVYIIMVATFGSLLQPLLLLISVPFAATGAIGLQVITGVPLGVPSFIGLLMLVGIVVTNAIVLIDLVNQYRAKGLAVREALVEGATRRLRPILMTALATIFALIPMAVGITGSGGFISQPLAIVVIGGLISSTLLTLVVLPTIYNLVEGGREKRKAKRAEKKAAKAGTTASAPVSKEPVFETLVVEDDGDDDSPIRRRTPSA
jgi:HAE1 family hydrophobic/amphiphilic exporter-1